MIMSLVGKTVAREHGDLVEFTDGTAVAVQGEGWLDTLSLDDVREWMHDEALEEEAQRQRDAARRAWMALDCVERWNERLRKKAERAKQPQSIFTNVFAMEIREYMMDTSRMMNRYLWGDVAGYFERDRCPFCYERECPSAPTRWVPPVTGLAIS